MHTGNCRIGAALRARVAHFAGLGALLFAIDAADVGLDWRTATERPRVILPAAVIAEERRTWIGRTGRTPTAAEEAEMTATAVADELLYREALRLGLDRTDTVVHRRLVQNMRFLLADEATGAAGATTADARVDFNGTLAAADASASDLDERARALSLDRGDEIVRRRLVQRMRLLLEARARAAEPTNAELEAYLLRHAAEYTEPARVDLSHVFLSRRRHGPRLDAVASALRQALVVDVATPEAAVGRGDPFPVPGRLPAQSAADLEAVFGRDLADAACELPLGVWGVPVRSPYGVHILWIHARRPARRPPLAAVEARVREQWRAERARLMFVATLEELRSRYDVSVESPALRALVR